MRKRNILSLLLVVVLILMAAPIVLAQYSPEVFTVDQDVVNGTVKVTRATINGPGWVVIHADADGAPGPVIGHAELMDGINASITVDVDVDGVTDTLFAMLHVDEGTVGEYEFPGPDAPVMVDDAPVTVAFAVTGITEVTPEPTEEATEEPAAEESSSDEAEATPEPTEEAAEEAEATPEPTEEAAEEAEAAGAAMADIVDTAVAAGSFNTLVELVQAAGLEDALRGEGPFTVFAPTDDAFAALPEGTIDSLKADPETLSAVLLYHVVPDKLMAADVADMGSAITLEGSMVEFTTEGAGVMVNDANVAAADVDASNGVIHVIDTVLLPPAVQEAMAAAEAAAAAPEEEATPEPVQKIAGKYQESDGSTVVVSMVEAAQPSWVVIHKDEAFTPGPILGYAEVPAGVSENVEVTLDEPLTELTMVWAMLHVDDGEAGVFEFPDADPPAMYNQSIVMAPFNVAVTSGEEMAAEATPEPTEEMTEEATPEPTEEMAEEATPEPTEEMAEEATPEPTEEMAEEATPEPTEEMAEEATPEPTEEMAEEATPEPTEEMAEEATPEPTEEMAEEATPEPTEEMAEEATAEPTEEMAEEAMAEATPEPTEEMAEEPAAEMTPEAPEELPETGGSFGGVGTTLPIVLGVLGLLAAGAFVTRRRPA